MVVVLLDANDMPGQCLQDDSEPMDTARLTAACPLQIEPENNLCGVDLDQHSDRGHAPDIPAT